MRLPRPHKPGRSNAKRRGASNRTPAQWGYLVMWEFRLRKGMKNHFEKAYGSDGDWVKLFEQDKSYIKSELVHDAKVERTYVTLDFWASRRAYDAFRKQHLAKYRTLDQKCEKMTDSEREIGRFIRLKNSGSG
jgi:heme-degrading monooxygenase HmoA